MRHGRLLAVLGVLALVVFSTTIGIARDRSRFQGHAWFGPKPGWCKKHPGQCPSTTTTTPPPTTTVPPPTTTTPPGPLRPVDGGQDYYSRFSYPLGGPDYFPIGVWAAYDQSQANITKDKASGFNLYVWPSDNNQSLTSFAANGMKAMLTSDWYSVPGMGTASANAGYFLGDEEDMRLGPGAGYTQMQQYNAQAPNDGRVRIANYSKGVLLWETDAEAARFVNDFQQITSTDLYWFTDPWQSTMVAPPWLPEAGRTISGSTVRRAANYGYQIDRLRQLDAMDGVRRPIWAIVESGWPFSNDQCGDCRAITPPEMRAAVWHSLIAGARGLEWFDTSFGGPCQVFHINRDTSGCYTAIQQELSRTDSQITQMAPVLNAPFEDSFASVSPSVRLMTKNYNGQRYIFAGSRGTSSTATFNVQGGSTVTVLFENRSISIASGSFTDSFADGNSIHIYRID